MSVAELAIRTAGLTRRYGPPQGGIVAVDHLDLAVEPGELFAFLGPNGAGKTTTIRMLTGLIRPTAGTALIDGIDVAQNPLAAKARVGVVPQRSNLYGELSARDNLIFMAQLYGLPRREWASRASELLSQFGLSDRANAPFAALSGGMKRRLTIAAALVHRPTLLFLDEPTTGLDVRSARSLRSLIGELHESGVTIFLTTHMISEAERLAGRVGIIVRGSLIAVNTPAALRERVQNEAALEVTVDGLDEALLRSLRGAGAVIAASRSGDTMRLVVRSVDAALRDVAAATERLGERVKAIRTVTPTLEDAFVQLTQLDVEAMQNGPARNRQGGRG